MIAPSHRIRPDTYLFFFVAFGLVVFLLHAPFLDLPFYWDELGQFVPAALDLFRTGAWIPHSTTPNVHPPGIPVYLAGFWSLAGYSIVSSRLAMLLLASAAVLVVFLLAIELCREARGTPAGVAVLLLCLSPLFYAQAMLVQLDMPAMLFTCLALLLFLRNRIIAAVAVSTVLVMVKETGVVVPLLFATWLWVEKRRREAAFFVFPVAVLGLWILVLARLTGHLFGDPEFTRYNLHFPLHPVRMAIALLRRIYTLFISSFHWIGTLAIFIAWRRTALFSSRAWKLTGTLGAAHTCTVAILGGAVLERYLLPVLPLLYIAFAAASSAFSRRWRLAGALVLGAGLAAANFVNPPYPFPYENNLAFTDFVKLHQSAAAFLEQEYPSETIATAWPLTSALARPEFGYVQRALTVREVGDFRSSRVNAAAAAARVFVLYSRSWEPDWRPLQESLASIWRLYYGYEPQITGAEVQRRLGMRPVARWVRRGQWVEVYAESPAEATLNR